MARALRVFERGRIVQSSDTVVVTANNVVFFLQSARHFLFASFSVLNYIITELILFLYLRSFFL